MANCLFCPKTANSKEHLWPKWIHELKDFGPLKQKRGDTDIIIPDPQVTVKCVCKGCNNEWMSDLETANIPLIGSMMQDLSIQLDRDQLKLVAAWCMKMAFLTDWTRTGGRVTKFYTADEGAAFAKDLTIPAHTRIWIGRLSTSQLSTDGHDLGLFTRADNLHVGTGSVVTFVVGHFVAQIVTDHPLPEYANMPMPDSQPKTGPWAAKLIQIWPPEREWDTLISCIASESARRSKRLRLEPLQGEREIWTGPPSNALRAPRREL
jgi:hypothetical protein